MMFQLLKGVDHLHSHKILHRDLKPQNILVKEDKWILKLADFCLSPILFFFFKFQKKFGNFRVSRVYSIPIRPYTKEVLPLYTELLK